MKNEDTPKRPLDENLQHAKSLVSSLLAALFREVIDIEGWTEDKILAVGAIAMARLETGSTDTTQHSPLSPERAEAILSEWFAAILPKTGNYPLMWSFFGAQWGGEQPTRSVIEAWLTAFDERGTEIGFREITRGCYQQSPTQALEALRTLQTLLWSGMSPKERTFGFYDSSTLFSIRRAIGSHIAILVPRFSWLRDHLPHKKFSLHDLRDSIYQLPIAERRKGLETMLSMFDEGDYWGNLSEMEVDLVRSWPDRLEANSREELASFLDTPPTTTIPTTAANAADTAIQERSSKPLTITGIVERELSNYSVDLSDTEVGNSIRDKYPDVVGDKDSWRCAVRDRRKKLRGKFGDSPERK